MRRKTCCLTGGPLMPLVLLGLMPAFMAHAQAGPQDSGDQDLAAKVANPVSNLISVPLQSNYDCCYGPEKASKYTLNLQPVVPFSINDRWNLITRTIIPYVNQGETAAGQDDTNGLGDITTSLFFSPKAAPGGIVWGIGPVLAWPTGASKLTSGKYSAGPTLIILKQSPGLTYGLLASHMWSYISLRDDRPDVSLTSLQPFISRTLPDSTTFSANLESTYDWQSEQWTVPLNLSVSHIFRFGKQPVSLSGGVRGYLASPEGGADWGLRLQATFLFPG